MTAENSGAVSDVVQRGISPRQHHDSTWPVADRCVTFSARVRRNDTDDPTQMLVIDDPENTYGDDLGWLLWEKDGGKRPCSGWGIQWPAVVTQAPHPSWPRPLCGQKRQNFSAARDGRRAVSSHQIRPLRAAGSFDSRFKAKVPALANPLGTPLPVGWTGTLGAGSEEYAQAEIFHPDMLGLVAPNRYGDKRLGTRVFDLTTQSGLDSGRWRELQSLVSVNDLGGGACGGGGKVLALQLGSPRLEKGKPGYLHLVDYDVCAIGSAAAKGGGPLVLNQYGGVACQHLLGRDKDGVDIRPVHLWTGSLFAGTGGDAPLRFEGGVWPETQDKGPVFQRVHLRLNRTLGHLPPIGCKGGNGVWDWYVRTTFYIEEGEDGDGIVGGGGGITKGGGPIGPAGPGGGGGGNPEGDGGLIWTPHAPINLGPLPEEFGPEPLGKSGIKDGGDLAPHQDFGQLINEDGVIDVLTTPGPFGIPTDPADDPDILPDGIPDSALDELLTPGPFGLPNGRDNNPDGVVDDLTTPGPFGIPGGGGTAGDGDGVVDELETPGPFEGRRPTTGNDRRRVPHASTNLNVLAPSFAGRAFATATGSEDLHRTTSALTGNDLAKWQRAPISYVQSAYAAGDGSWDNWTSGLDSSGYYGASGGYALHPIDVEPAHLLAGDYEGETPARSSAYVATQCYPPEMSQIAFATPDTGTGGGSNGFVMSGEGATFDLVFSELSGAGATTELMRLDLSQSALRLDGTGALQVLEQASAAGNLTNYGALSADTDGHPYWVSSAGTFDLTSSADSSSIILNDETSTLGGGTYATLATVKTLTLPAGQLATNGDAIIIRGSGFTEADAGSYRVLIQIGGTSVVLSTDPIAPDKQIRYEVRVVRRGASAGYASGICYYGPIGTSAGNAVDATWITEVSLSLTWANTQEIRSQAATPGGNQYTDEWMQVEYLPNP